MQGEIQPKMHAHNYYKHIPHPCGLDDSQIPWFPDLPINNLIILQTLQTNIIILLTTLIHTFVSIQICMNQIHC